MTRLFIETKEFTKQCEELGIEDEVLRLLEIDIMRNPDKLAKKELNAIKKAIVELERNLGGERDGK